MSLTLVSFRKRAVTIGTVCRRLLVVIEFGFTLLSYQTDFRVIVLHIRHSQLPFLLDSVGTSLSQKGRLSHLSALGKEIVHSVAIRCQGHCRVRGSRAELCPGPCALSTLDSWVVAAAAITALGVAKLLNLPDSLPFHTHMSVIRCRCI